MYPLDDIRVIAVNEMDYSKGLPNYRWISQYLTDEIISNCLSFPSIKIVEREDLQSITNEMKLQLSGLANENKIELGGLTIADELIIGSYFVESGYVYVSLRLVDVNTSQIISSSSDKCPLENIDELLQYSVNKLFENYQIKRDYDLLLNKTSTRNQKIIHQAKTFYYSLPFHELHPRRRRMRRDFEQTINDLEEIVNDTSLNAYLFYLLGQFYLQIESYDEATQYFEYLLNIDSAKHYGHLGLGDLNRFNKNNDIATFHYQKVLKTQNDVIADAYYGLVKSYIKQSKNEDAIDSLLKLLELKPDLSVARNLFKNFIQRTHNYSTNAPIETLLGIKQFHENPSGALSLLKKAAENYPNYYYPYFLLGKYYREKEDYKNAGHYLNLSKKLFPGFDKTYYELGYLYYNLQNYSLATKYFKTYIALSHDGSDFTEVRKLIELCEKH